MTSQLFILKLAWKNILRHPGRSFFIAFTVALSVGIGIWIMSLFDGMNNQIEQAVKNAHTGEYQWMKPEFKDRLDTDLSFTLDDQILNKIGKTPYSPELLLAGHVSAPEGSLSVVLIGRTPALTEKVLPIEPYIIRGDASGLTVGESFTEYYHLSVGDQIVFNFQDQNGELKSELMPITGIYKRNGFAFEKRVIYVQHEVVQRLYLGATTPPVFNRIVFNQLPLIQAPKDLKLFTWRDINPEMHTITQFHDGMVLFFMMFMGIAILVTILTPINMVWFERLSEVKMMKIIGIKNGKIRPMAVYESFIMSCFSFVLSVIIYLIIVGHQQKHGIDASALLDGKPVERGGIQLLGTLYPIMKFRHIIFCAFFVFTTIITSYHLAISSVLRRVKRL